MGLLLSNRSKIKSIIMLPYPLSDLDRVGLELFWSFARVEGALKAAGFLKKLNGPAEADWDRFAQSITGALEADSRLATAIAYMRQHPPMKQMARNGQLRFERAAVNGNSTQELIACVKRVRNNLFHGGKFNGEWFDPARSEALIRHSLLILEGCLQASPQLRAVYNV